MRNPARRQTNHKTLPMIGRVLLGKLPRWSDLRSEIFFSSENAIRRLDVRACLENWCLLNSSFGCNLYASVIQRFQPPRSGFPPTSCQVRNIARPWRSQIYFCWFARVDLRKRWGQGRKKTEQENRGDRGRVATYVSSDTGPIQSGQLDPPWSNSQHTTHIDG